MTQNRRRGGSEKTRVRRKRERWSKYESCPRGPPKIDSEGRSVHLVTMRFLKTLVVAG